jgi:hypothetical protein
MTDAERIAELKRRVEIIVGHVKNIEHGLDGLPDNVMKLVQIACDRMLTALREGGIVQDGDQVEIVSPKKLRQ